MKNVNPPLKNMFRQRAEEILQSRLPITGTPLSEEETLKLIRELEIKQIELELQNEELLRNKRKNLISKSGATKILNLIDFEEVNKLLEGFNQSTGFVTAILDLEGNVLSKSGWRQICTEFHRINPNTSKNCTLSDTILANELGIGEKYHFYECLNGLVDVAVPIVINGEHIASLFSGQFFFDEPNRTFFKKQAEKYGFDEQEYLKSLENVPVVSKEKVKVAMDFLLDMTKLISEMTFQKLEQVQLNEALYKSEERSRNALDHLLEGCQILGFDWRYIYLNQTAEIHNKRPKNELLGRRYMDMWPGIEETGVFQVIRRTLEERVSAHFENEFTFPDGSLGWFDLSIQPVPEGAFILSIDITERKRAENALRDSEEKYRLIADNSDDWIYWVAPNGKLNYVSPACEWVTGYSPEEFVRQPDLNHEIIFDADKKKVGRHIKEIKQEDIPHTIEFRIVNKSGETRWISHSCSPIFSDEGEYLGRRGTNRNITERKLREEQLFESEFRFSKLYENGPFGMVIADKEFRFKKVNPAFCDIIGYNEAELMQFTFKDVSHPDDLTKDLSNVRKLMNKEIPVYKTEKRYIRKDGRVIWGSLTVTSTYDSEGQFLYNLGIIEDITHRKQVEEDLKKSKKLLSETESMGKVGGWEFNIDTFDQTWTDEVYRIHELDLDFKQNVDAGINFYAPDSKPIIEKAVQRVLEFGEPFDLELEIITAKGNLRKVHTRGKPDMENRRVYGFFQDITERKQAEEEIQKLNERISTATHASQVGIWDWDIQNNVLAWDEQMYAIYGLKKDEFTGAIEAWINGLHPDDKEHGAKQTEMALNGEKEYDTEFRIVWPDGTIRHCKAKGEVFRNENGEPVRMVGVNYDITERKNAEETLKISEERYRNIFESSAIGIYRTTPDGQILMANPTLINLLGFDSFEELAKRNLENEGYEQEGERTKFRESIEKDGSVTGLESVWKTKDGKTVVVNENAKAFYDNNGQVIYYEGTIEDITRRKLAERTLLESEEKFRLAFSTNPDAITITRLKDGVYVSANKGFSQIFEYLEEEVIGKTSLEINMWYNPDDRKQFIHELKTKGKVENFEARLCTKSGKIKDTLVSSTILEFEGDTHLLSTTRDITERKLAEEALRESEEKFRKLLESIPLPVTFVNSRGEIVFRNDRFLEVLGYSHEEVPTVNEWWGKAYPDENYQKQVIEQWGLAVEEANKLNSDIEPIEYRITCKDGFERTMIVSGIIIEDNLLITFIDITDRKKAEEEVRSLNETLEQRVEERTSQLQEANKELEAFSYSVSHDLRAPLRHINGFVDILTENYNDLLPEKGKHYLSVIANASTQMGSLIDDLLQFSRTGRQEMQQVNLNMNIVIQEVLNLVKQDTRGRKIEWAISDLPTLNGDQSLLRMVWYNLLSNAIKFTKGKNPAIIKVGYRNEKNEYVFFVRDNGAGFDMRYAHKLFGVFQRLHTTKEFEGTGIGLANVRRIILKHGGRTWAESQLNEGATFYFTIPKPN